MFKWVCLLVAVVALSAFGWMLNDIRIQLRSLTVQTDQHLPRILTNTEQITSQLDRNLPHLLTKASTAIDNLAELSDTLAQYRGVMGTVHAASQDKDLFSYGTSILDLIAGQKATIGIQKTAAERPAKPPLPAKQWVAAARKHNNFLSLVASSKADVLHGLARTDTATPWFIKLEDQAPRLLADWIKEAHPPSKGVN